MILRKPYAFLIKQFRIIHLLLSFVVAYLIYNTTDILKIYNSYISSKQLGDISVLSRPLMFLALFVFIVSILIVAIVLKIKKKPIMLYVINTVITITVIGVYAYAYSTLKTLQIGAVDIRIVRAIRDILIILVFLQGIQFITLFVRATGFDIKKFDFGADLIGLQITDEDREEVEVSLEVDSDVSKRKIVGFLRNFKYTYIENKLLFNILFSGIFLAILVFIGYKIIFKSKIYEIGEKFTIDNVVISVNNSYMTDKNYNGEVITSEYEYVILDLSVKSILDNQRLNLGNVYLSINGKKYFAITTNTNNFIDLGKVYSNQVLSKEDFDKYLIVFKVLKSDVETQIKLVVNSSINSGKYEQVNIGKLVNDSVGDTKIYGFDDELIFDTEYLKGYLNISGIELSHEFHENYSYCYKENCDIYDYYVVASSLKNYNTTLIKLDASFESENTDFTQFIKNYGIIRYGNDESQKYSQIEMVESKMDNYYLEVNSDINNASNIYLDLNLRNNKYTIKLK